MPFVPYFDRIELGAMWSEAEHMQDEERSRCRWSLARGWAEEAEEISRCPTVSSLPKTFRKFLAEDFSTKLLKIIWTTSGFLTDLALHFQRHLIAAQHSHSVGIIWNNLNPKKTSPTSCQKSIWVNYNDLTVLPNPGIMVYPIGKSSPFLAELFRLVNYCSILFHLPISIHFFEESIPPCAGSEDRGPIGAHAGAPAQCLRGGGFSVRWELGEVCEDGARSDTSGGVRRIGKGVSGNNLSNDY